MLSGMRRRRVGPRAALARAGLQRPPDSRERMPIGDYAALYNAVVRELGDEGFGLFSAPLRPGTFEFLCRAMLGSANLGEALERGARFLALVLPDLAVSIERDGGIAKLRIEETRPLARRADHPARVFAFEWLLRLLHGLACWLAARGLALDEVAFPFPKPPHAADYTLVYTERSRFGAPALSATMDAALLDLPLRRQPADLDAFLEGAPGKITMLYRRDREMVRAVRERISASLASPPSLAEIARSLNLSPRTLHRRLDEEGSSYRAIKDAVRRQAALARLQAPGASVAAVAAELGYSEPSAFFRAFQGWTGEAPSRYRARVVKTVTSVSKKRHS